MMDHVVVDGR